ncbi:hypothetical protein KIH41_05640 [Litoribacter ruber]|uniref:Uncharacterized protein n=1 Tax=Litoribacter ruber TaxID=702568 RepID=A0AAP2CEM3_9BACT|nr:MULTISPECIES: hypothetical protein [Litoribacter]MBS9523078.1 hypothetical protein [Litoribacter alkaliphilus]MBT0810759.1 hypothetical protein [Litoribacter ruber]
MRIVKEMTVSDVRVSIFSWNNKYLLKFEQGMVEQTFKVSETDILEESDLDQFLGGPFFDAVQKRFEEMHQSLYNQL